VQASSSRLIVTKSQAGVVDISSSDTGALLDSLFFSPSCNSPASLLRPNSDADSLEDWPEGNDMAATVYVALSADTSNSRKPANDAPCDGRESCFSNSLVQKTRKTR
jgi:hypothetical protein